MIPNDVKGTTAYRCRIEVPHQALRLSTCAVVAETKHMRTWVSRSTRRPTYSAVPTATTYSMEVGSARTCQSGSATTTGNNLSIDSVDSLNPTSSGKGATLIQVRASTLLEIPYVTTLEQ